MGLGALQQLVSIGPQDLTINPRYLKSWPWVLEDHFTDFVEENKFWLLLGLVVLVAMLYITLTKK